jgi:acylglycerol lipase
MQTTVTLSATQSAPLTPTTSARRSPDGTVLHAYHWPVAGTPRAVIALVHGMSEHAGRYQEFAERCHAQGIEVHALDLRGHGRSAGRRVWIDRFDEYLDDVDTLLGAVKHTTAPLFLMGHSMGGAIAALHSIERGETHRPLAGLIMSSPALAPGRDIPRWKLAAGDLMSRVWPTFPALTIEPSQLSRDPQVVAANRTDPLVHHDAVPARTGAQVLAAMERIRLGRDALTLPILLFHGTADKLTEPEGSREFRMQTASPDCTLKLYPGNYHETLNDVERERVYADLFDWIDAHLPAATNADTSTSAIA